MQQRAVSGFNVSEVVEALLDSGLTFHNLSAGGKKWGESARRASLTARVE